jgi:hypothetical protein
MHNEQPGTLARLASLGPKFRERGWGWLARRLYGELRAPETRTGLLVRPVTSGLVDLALRPLRAALRAEGRQFDDTLVYFFDLDVVPITFDVLTYLADAELERRRRGLARVHVVVVPGRHGGWREEEPEFERIVGHDARYWRLYNLVIPSFGLLPSLASYTVSASRAHAGRIHAMARHVAPKGYLVSMPVATWNGDVFGAPEPAEAVQYVRTPPEALRHVGAWLEARASARKVVAITLRDYDFMPRRNSNRAAWLRFARELDPAEYFPVIVLDTNAAMADLGRDLDGLAVFAEASWNIWLRSALYELAHLSVSSMQGATDLCWYNLRCRYLQFVSVGSSPQSTEAYFRREGYPFGESFAMATPHQRLVWAPDGYDRITAEFAAMCRVLDGIEPAPADRLRAAG